MDDNTFFAPSKRDLREVVFLDYQQISENEYLTAMLNAMPELAAILNEKRQIVFANKSLVGFLNLLDSAEIIGERPGEAINCVNAKNNTGGCGTSENCRYCGAVNAIIESQNSEEKIVRDCRIRTAADTAEEFLDLKVTATPFNYKTKKYTILAIEDVSDQKRRMILERVFFHDILNIAGSIKGFADLLKTTNAHEHMLEGSDVEEYLDIMGKLSGELLEEILSQRTLLSAEVGDLKTAISAIPSLNLLKDTISYLSINGFSEKKLMVISQDSEDILIHSDVTLLKRVVINMLKNALEASFEDQTVTLKCVKVGESVEISIHNQSVMPKEVQAQIFQRSFSTKGVDRGIGTYSIKLLTERYLMGQVGFHSAPHEGTTFFARIPL